MGLSYGNPGLKVIGEMYSFCTQSNLCLVLEKHLTVMMAVNLAFAK